MRLPGSFDFLSITPIIMSGGEGAIDEGEQREPDFRYRRWTTVDPDSVARPRRDRPSMLGRICSSDCSR